MGRAHASEAAGGAAASWSPSSTRRTTRSAARPSSQRAEARAERRPLRVGLRGRHRAGAQDAEQLVLAAADHAGRLRHQVEVDAARGPVALPVGGVDHDRAVEHGVVEHEAGIVCHQDVGRQAQGLDRGMRGDVEQPPLAVERAGDRVRIVEVVRAGEQHAVRAERRGRRAEVEHGHVARLPVAVRRRVEHRALPGLEAERRAGGRDRLLRRRGQHVVARVADLEVLVLDGVDLRPDLGGERVGGDAEVPPRAAAQQRVEVHLGRGHGVRAQVHPHRLQRRPVVGHHVDGARALDVLVGEVDVVDEVLGPRHDVEVLRRVRRDDLDALGHLVVVLGLDDPDAADLRRELARLLVDRPRVAGVGGVPVRGVDGELLVHRALERGAVGAAAALRAQALRRARPEPPGAAAGGALGAVGPADGAVGARVVAGEQARAHPGEPAALAAGAVRVDERGDAVEERVVLVRRRLLEQGEQVPHGRGGDELAPGGREVGEDGLVGGEPYFFYKHGGLAGPGQNWRPTSARRTDRQTRRR